jgi:hypothetical protein
MYNSLTLIAQASLLVVKGGLICLLPTLALYYIGVRIYVALTPRKNRVR